MKIREFLYFGFSEVIRQPGKAFDPIKSSWFFKGKGYIYFMLCITIVYIGNLVLALINDRLFVDSSAATYNYFEDIPNQINYLLICPAYVTALIYYIRLSRQQVKNQESTGLLNKLDIDKEKLSLNKFGKAFWIILILIGLFIVILQYNKELNKYQFIFYVFAESIIETTSSAQPHEKVTPAPP